MILAGDVGGTKTVLALFDDAGGELRPVRDATFPSRDHASLEEIVAAFLAADEAVPPRAACFGVAGAVIDGKSQATNLPWHLDEGRLARAGGAPRAKLLNDLEATAYGMLHLRPDELAPLNPKAAAPRKGNVAVIAAGTGLGEAMLYWDGRRYHPIASEGGHGDFGPRTDQEIELLRYLRQRHGHVSYERVLSGPGLHNVYNFLRDSGAHPEPAALAERLAAAADPSAVISELALAGQEPLCAAALELFCTLYGAEAGNLALKCVAVGVFVGGGIAPKILPALRKGAFLRGFTDKGRFATLLEPVPVSVALNPRAALLGAAHYAAGMA
ncbi:MAG TPA: glucokinase [Gemmataceae bacterium]|jgi:glucokinase|nr:glucokinase [Gemmataceae bacterium]